MSAALSLGLLYRRLLAICVMLLVSHGLAAQTTLPLSDLQGFDFKAKTAAINAIAESGSARATDILTALLDGRLLMRKADSRMVIVANSEAKTSISDALDGSDLGSEELTNLKKVVINNQLRLVLRVALARLALANPDRAARLAAVESLAADNAPGTQTALIEALPKEQDSGVRRAMEVVLALGDIANPDEAKRLAAVNTVNGSMLSEVRNRLATLIAKDAEGKPVEPSMDVRVAAANAIRAIDELRAHYEFIQTIFFGLSLGFVLVLAATGLAITFGVMGVINMAHGEMIAVGAYTTYVVQNIFGTGLALSPFGFSFHLPGMNTGGWLYESYFIFALPLSFLSAALVGIAMERTVIQWLYRRPLESLLATWGVSLFLQQFFRRVFGSNNVQVSSPSYLSDNWTFHDIIFGWNRVFVIGFAGLIVLGVWLVLTRTSLGLLIRAVMQNRSMAACMGIRTERVNMLTFGLGSGLAGLAGAFLSQIGNVGPSLGQSYIVDCFMTVVVGGVGNLPGTVVSAFGIGLADQSLQQILLNPVLGKITVLVAIILFLQWRPAGIFVTKSRSLEG